MDTRLLCSTLMGLLLCLPLPAEECNPDPGGQPPPRQDPAQGGNPPDQGGGVPLPPDPGPGDQPPDAGQGGTGAPAAPILWIEGLMGSEGFTLPSLVFSSGGGETAAGTWSPFIVIGEPIVGDPGGAGLTACLGFCCTIDIGPPPEDELDWWDFDVDDPEDTGGGTGGGKGDQKGKTPEDEGTKPAGGGGGEDNEAYWREIARIYTEKAEQQAKAAEEYKERGDTFNEGQARQSAEVARETADIAEHQANADARRKGSGGGTQGGRK